MGDDDDTDDGDDVARKEVYSYCLNEDIFWRKWSPLLNLVHSAISY
jgi:hypothetical protein